MDILTRRSLRLGLLLALLALALPAQAQMATALADFSGNPGNGLYSYASSTPATVMDLMQSNRPRPVATAQGQLVLPANAPADARMPAVVLVHGSGGIYPEQLTFWSRLLNDQGIAS